METKPGIIMKVQIGAFSNFQVINYTHKMFIKDTYRKLVSIYLSITTILL